MSKEELTGEEARVKAVLADLGFKYTHERILNTELILDTGIRSTQIVALVRLLVDRGIL